MEAIDTVGIRLVNFFIMGGLMRWIKMGILFFGCLSLLMITGCKKEKWEYKTMNVSSEGHGRTGIDSGKFATINPDQAELQKLGSEGWELVTSYLEMETSFPNFGAQNLVIGIQPNIRPQRVVLIFKRRSTQ